MMRQGGAGKPSHRTGRPREGDGALDNVAPERLSTRLPVSVVEQHVGLPGYRIVMPARGFRLRVKPLVASVKSLDS